MTKKLPHKEFRFLFRKDGGGIFGKKHGAIVVLTFFYGGHGNIVCARETVGPSKVSKKPLLWTPQVWGRHEKKRFFRVFVKGKEEEAFSRPKRPLRNPPLFSLSGKKLVISQKRQGGKKDWPREKIMQFAECVCEMRILWNILIVWHWALPNLSWEKKTRYFFFFFPLSHLPLTIRLSEKARRAIRYFFRIFPLSFWGNRVNNFSFVRWKMGKCMAFSPTLPIFFSLMSEWEEETLNFLATDTPFPHSFLGKKGIKNKKGASPFKIWIDFSDRREREKNLFEVLRSMQSVSEIFFFRLLTWNLISADAATPHVFPQERNAKYQIK